MPGSWELAQSKQVIGAILHVDLTSIAWAYGFRKLQPYGMPFLPMTGAPYDDARNRACEIALKEGFQSLFFLDSDCIPPADAILRLLAHKADFISGVYFRRSPPHGLPVMIKNGGWYTNYRRGAVVEVDRVGAGCLLLSRHFLESIPPQRPGHAWFDWRVNYRGTGAFPEETCTSEDFTLCDHARANGFKVLVDTSIICRHCGLAEAGDNTFQPAQVVA